jgi:hypothetical protein
MTLETGKQGPTLGEVPGLEQKRLTDGERRRLERALARIENAEAGVVEARAAFAALVRELGISASARAMGVTPQALSERVKTIERSAKG